MRDAAATSWILDVDDNQFEEDVARRSLETPVVVDFWSPSCGPCRTLGPMLEAHARARKGAFVLAKVNVDHAHQLAGYFQIEGVPTVVAIRNAELIDQFVGLLPPDQLQAFIDRICPNELDQSAAQAATLEASDPTRAEQLYREILGKNPDHEPARVGLARLLVTAGKYGEAGDLLSPLGSSGEIGTEAERLRRIIEMSQGAAAGNEADLRQRIAAEPGNARLRYELGSLLAHQARYADALEMLLSAAELDKQIGKNEVRELMVKIFQIIGIRSEMADDYRSRLQSMLY
jgi:putative thioredoxin